MSSPILCAKALPRDMSTLGEFEEWLLSLNLCICGSKTKAPVPVANFELASVDDDIPITWEESLARLPFGFIAVTGVTCQRIVRRRGNLVKALSFDDLLPAGTMVVLNKIAA